MSNSEVSTSRLQRRIIADRKKVSEIYERIQRNIDMLQGKCDHNQTSDYKWEHDNGYGRQHMRIGKKCNFCGWISLGNDNRFITPKDIMD